MCSIIGCYREEGINSNDLVILLKLIEKNKIRGPVAYGIISNKKIIKSISTPDEINIELLNLFSSSKYIFIHLRAPTGNTYNTLDLTQPYYDDENILLFNGILTDWNKEKYKNDTDEIFENIKYGDIANLDALKGSYALVYMFKTRLYLIRCINTLFYDDYFFSSTKFDNSKELGHGEILDFKTKKITKFNVYNPYQIL